MIQRRKISNFVLCLCAAVICRGQGIITTFAGTDVTYPSTSFPANSASFGQLISTAVSPSGQVYFVSESRSLVLKFDPATNTVSVVAGIGVSGYSGDGSSAKGAALSNPQGIAFDKAGNLYIADNGNQVVRKVDTQGMMTTYASAPYVVGLAFGPDGTLYGSNYIQIYKVNQGGAPTVIAGGSVTGYAGDSGPAAKALFDGPAGIAFDKAGNLLIADKGNNAIRKIDTKGNITTIAGNGHDGSSVAGPATATNVSSPIGLALDGSGNLYTGGFNSAQLLKIDPNGNLSVLNPNPTTFFFTTAGPVAKAAVGSPAWTAVDSAGNLYVADQGAECLWEVTPAGSIQATAVYAPNYGIGDNGPAVLAGLNGPFGIALAPDGSLLIADQFNERVRRVAPSGNISTVAGDGSYGVTTPGPALSTALNIPRAVAADASGNIYVYNQSEVFRINPVGVLSIFYQPSAFVYGIATDPQGNLLLATSGNQILRVSPSGTASVVAGTGTAGFSGDGGPATKAQLYLPEAVTTDSAGNIYVADTNNNLIRKISTNGIISTIGGGGPNEKDGVPATQSAIYTPVALAVDSSGNVYVSEFSNRVRMISSGGMISAVAGNTAGFSGDGGLALSASLNEPYGLAVDKAGNVYISDRLNNRVREILAAPPSIAVSSTNVPVTAPSSGMPVQSSITVTSSAPGLGYSLSFATQTGGNWLSANLAQGQAPGTFTVIADPANLAPASYQGTITVTSPNAVPPAQVISVSFQVTAGMPPQLAAGNGPLSFSLTTGSTPATAQLTVSNQGGGSISFTASAGTVSGGQWLQVSPASGTATASTPVSLTVTATPGSLVPGTYSGFIAVTSATTGQTVTVSAALAVSAVQQSLLLSQTGLTFTAVAQGGSPLPQSFAILNTGQGSMSWSASATTLSGGTWLSIDQSSGSVATPYTDVSMVNVSVNPSGLAAGNYYGQIQVTAPGAPNSPQSVSVVLNVLAAGSTPGAEIRPTGLIFIGQPGINPGAQTVMVSNPQASPITFGGSFFTVPTGGAWARFLPANATVQPNAPVQMLVQPDYTNLTSGSYQGFVSLGFADGSSRSVHVLAVVAPPAAQSASAADLGLKPLASNSCLPIKVQPTSLTDPGSSVTIGVPASLQVRAVDNCGNLITSSNGAVGATFSDGEASVTLVHEGSGNWGGTWTPRNAGAASVTITYVAAEGSGTSVLKGTAPLTVAVLPANGTPLTAGANNSASGLGAYISPGGLVSIYGQQFASQDVINNNPPFPVTTNGTQVLMGGIPLPMRYVGSGQINAQVPFGVGINTQQQLIVQNNNTLSVPVSVVVAAAQPGIYTQDHSGSGPGIIVDYQSGQVIDANHPAHVGDTLTIYCNGLGAVNPPLQTGLPAPTDGTLEQTANPVTVTIGGISEAAAFAGLTPGYPDLYQVNATVPGGVQASDAVSVVLTVAGQSSPAVVTMAVK